MDLSILNDNQLKAVTTTEGPVMVMAGAGSGKTRVLTYRLAYLVSELGVNKNNILAVTFTNKAAREMKERIGKLLNVNTDGMWVSTFHSFCARFLRREIKAIDRKNDFVIIDDEDSLKIVKEEIKKANLTILPKDALMLISNLKNEESLRDLDSFERREFEIIYAAYQNHLIKENLVDFDDLLLLTVQVLEKDERVLFKYNSLFNYIMIDEFQDTNKIQFKLINLLCKERKNIFIVGDINQSIYAFRGAKIENVGLFKKLYHPEVIKLEQNYRSTKNILKIANNVIKKNNSFVNMELFSNGKDGEKATYYRADSNYGEVIYIIKEINKLLKEGYHYKDMAILYRLNSLSLNFENEFVKHNIPYVIYGGVGYFERKEVKDIIAYLRLIINSEDDFSFKRIVNMPKRKIGDKLLKGLLDHSLDKGVSLYEAIPSYNNRLLNDFYRMIEDLKEDLLKLNLDDLVTQIFEKTGYLAMLKVQEEDDRIDNILELKSIMKDVMESYEGDNPTKLSLFLQDLALKTDVDNVKENDDKVKLMSFHQAKGLEYKVVFMIAMEQGIFPSFRSIGNQAEEEEERRICYVGVTRAMEKLYFTNAEIRRLYGQDNRSVPSVFIRDIKGDLINNLSLREAPFEANNSFNRYIVERRKEREERTEDEARFRVGDKLRHKVFGEGMVVKVEGDLITVAFSVEHGIKNLMANHPSITKI